MGGIEGERDMRKWKRESSLKRWAADSLSHSLPLSLPFARTAAPALTESFSRSLRERESERTLKEQRVTDNNFQRYTPPFLVSFLSNLSLSLSVSLSLFLSLSLSP